MLVLTINVTKYLVNFTRRTCHSCSFVLGCSLTELGYDDPVAGDNIEEDSQDVVDALNPMKSGRWKRTRQLPPQIAFLVALLLPLSIAAPVMSDSQPLEEMSRECRGGISVMCLVSTFTKVELHNLGNGPRVVCGISS